VRESPDHHDAELILRLYELRREEKLRRAREWYLREFRAETSEDFARQCPPGSDARTSFRMVVSYWEMAASIVNHGLIKANFFFESNSEFFVVWDRLKPLARILREEYRNPHQWTNLEALAGEFEKWISKQAPGALDALRNRLQALTKASSS